MRGERALLRIGEYLVGRACRHLPRKIREDRYREWAAELPAILHDPEIRFAPRRAVRMLGYAADTLRGAALMPGPARRRPTGPWAIWLGQAVQAPGDWANYFFMAWFFLPVLWLIRPGGATLKRHPGAPAR
jgi:hypothetical protein